MGSEIITSSDRHVAPISTPEGETALRSISSSAAWRVDADEIAGWLTPALREALPLAIAQATAQTAPARGADFKRHVLPTLVLVSPSGWTQEQSAAWQAAAIQELSGIPADLLAIGAAAARKVADHPSKIIPAIHNAIRSSWERRRATVARLRLIDDVAAGRRKRLPWESDRFDRSDICPPNEVEKILAETGVTLDARTPRATPGPIRRPTDADYAAMGVTAEQLAASRAADAAEREALRTSAADPKTPTVETGPPITEDGLCPHCGSSGHWVEERDGLLFCDHPEGCGKVWKPVAQAA